MQEPNQMMPAARFVVFAAAAGAVVILATASGAAPPTTGPSRVVEQVRPLPRLVDLGSGRCVPCKAMAPILEGLRTEYAGRMQVQFIDVWKDPDAARPYDIRLIPTQVFYGADGKELARHEGFMSREEILSQWKRSGVNL
jgi:thioredoxin 1